MRLKRDGRRGFSLLEVEVSFVLFAIALTGIGPMLVVQSRQVERLEKRFDTANTYYVTPLTEGWARKLGSTASTSTINPGTKPSPPRLILDNGDSDYVETGSGWSTKTNSAAYLGNYRTHGKSKDKDKDKDKGSYSASWTFTGLDPGWYEVQATWAKLDQENHALFTCFDGNRKLGKETVDQGRAPVGSTYNGKPFQSLGQFSVQGTSLKVELTDQDNDGVAADAVRLISVRNVLTIDALTTDTLSDTVSASVSVTQKVP